MSENMEIEEGKSTPEDREVLNKEPIDSVGQDEKISEKEEGDVVLDLMPMAPMDVGLSSEEVIPPKTPKTPRERKRGRSNSKSGEKKNRSRSNSRGSGSDSPGKGGTQPTVKKTPFKIVPGGIGHSARSPPKKEEKKLEIEQAIEEEPSFHPPTPVTADGKEETRHVRAGSAAVIQRAFRKHATRRKRAFTNTNMEEKEALRMSAGFQALQDIRSKALNWEDLKDMKQITSGMFGDVHIATFQGLQVIVKTLKPFVPPKDAPKKNLKKLQEEEQLAISDFKKEMSMLTKLWHRNIVHLIGVGVKPKLFMVMEYMEGGSLKEVLAEARKLNQPLPRNLVYDYALDCCHGMRYLHEAFPRILHRDLKPANLLISKPKDEEGRPELRIADFGLSRVLGPHQIHATERYRLTGGTGSLRYMAPEVAANQPYNEKADVYGFGIILWEMLANDLPYKTLHTNNFYKEVVKKKVRPVPDPAWPNDVSRLIQDTWAHDPDRRPTFRQVIERLQYIRETTDFFNGEQEKVSGCCTIL